MTAGAGRASSPSELGFGGFPFHEFGYASALAHLGAATTVDGVAFPVLARRIPGSLWCDGVLPPPYIDPTPDELANLADGLPDMVSIVGLIRPGSAHRWSEVVDVSPAKEHYVFDAGRPFRLSNRATRHVASGARRWNFELAEGLRVAATAAAMHARVAEFRGFAGSSVAFPAVHFDYVAHAPWGVFFTVVGPGGDLGAVACGALWNEDLHLLHLSVSGAGLRSEASYVLMAGITDWCAATDRRMFFGSMPRTGTGGLARFKARWTNQQLRSFLIRIVVRPDEYRSLPRFPGNPDSFFPAYRAPG